MFENLLILDVDGYGRIVKETAAAMGFFNKITLTEIEHLESKYDNSDYIKDKELPTGVSKNFEKYLSEYTYAFPAVENNETRMNWLIDLESIGFKIPVLIHPASYISPECKIEIGTVVEAKAVVSIGVVIEKGCIISIGSLIDHDAVIGNGSYIACGAIVKAGVTVGEKINVKSGAVVQYTENNVNYSFDAGM
jgi:acetyltransferase-like isoleucine patch superfamily enzyme